MPKLRKSKTAKKQSLKDDQPPLTQADRDKIKSIAAGIETSKNRTFIVACFLVAALFMGVFQSGPILSKLEKGAPNLISDSVKVIAREWHVTMSRLGFGDMNNQMRDTVHAILPNTQDEIELIEIDLKDGSSMALRGAAKPDEGEELRVAENEERTTTTFGLHRLRGSF